MRQTRRALIGNLATLFVAAPAVIRIPNLLMAVRPEKIITAHHTERWQDPGGSETDKDVFWDAFPPGSREDFKKYFG
jgi:hypothetical protein